LCPRYRTPSDSEWAPCKPTKCLLKQAWPAGGLLPVGLWDGAVLLTRCAASRGGVSSSQAADATHLVTVFCEACSLREVGAGRPLAGDQLDRRFDARQRRTGITCDITYDNFTSKTLKPVSASKCSRRFCKSVSSFRFAFTNLSRTTSAMATIVASTTRCRSGFGLSRSVMHDAAKSRPPPDLIRPSVPSRIPLAGARGSEPLILSRDREGAVVNSNTFQPAYLALRAVSAGQHAVPIWSVARVALPTSQLSSGARMKALDTRRYA
jgi:hypothetical protein